MSYTPHILIGAGGTGSHLIGPLLAYLNAWYRNQEDAEWDLVIVDGDNYEAKNLERQMFDPKFVGLNKAEALASMYSQYPTIAVPKFIGAEDLQDIMDEGCYVYLGVDNYSIRALVEQRAYQLQNVVVINGGNEKDTGSVQLWVRENGENKTPPLSYLHPEIKYLSADDRSNMTCAEVANMPGGEQLIIANMAAAQHMMTAIWRYHTDMWKEGWTELQFDLKAGIEHMDYRTMRNWERDRVVEIPDRALTLNPA
jgi:molybdopterin/thiamine biosynthesis adenylyltransferase